MEEVDRAHRGDGWFGAIPHADQVEIGIRGEPRDNRALPVDEGEAPEGLVYRHCPCGDRERACSPVHR